MALPTRASSPSERALQDPVGGDVGEVRAGVEARVEVDVAVLAVAQVGVHRGDVGRRQVGSVLPQPVGQQGQRPAHLGGDADLPVEPVAVVALRLVAVVVARAATPARRRPAAGRAASPCRSEAGPGRAGRERDLVQVLEGQRCRLASLVPRLSPANSSPSPARSMAASRCRAVLSMAASLAATSGRALTSAVPAKIATVLASSRA